MSIELQFKKGSLALRVLLKDEALTKLQNIVAEFQSDEELPPPTMPIQVISTPSPAASSSPSTNGDSMTAAKEWLARFSASEALNLIGWKTNSEKILILGAFHEAKGGAEGWRSADMETRFSEAREGFPGNFPRDMHNAIKDNWIATVTPRTYKVSRTGWNKVAEVVSTLSNA